MRCRSALLASAIAGFAVTAAAGGRYLAGEPGSWSKWNFRTYEFSTKLASRDEANALGEQLRSLDEILRRTPPADQPVGYRCESWGTGATHMNDVPGRPKLAEMPLWGGVTFGAFALFEYERNGQWIRDKGGETELMTFTVNNLQPRLLSHDQIPDDWRDLNTDAFLIPEQTGTVGSFPRYGDYIVIKKKPDPLWLPLSMDTALRLSAESARKSLRAAEESKYSTTENRRQLADVANRLDARIAALSAADRTAAACWIRDYQMPIEDRIQKVGSARCIPVGIPNWKFFDLRLPRSAPQVVLVTSIGRCYEPARLGKPDEVAGGCSVNRAILEAIDRQALMNWLR